MPAAVLDVLADDTRRRIVELLAAGDRAAGDIASQFPVSGPAISRHLRLLRESGVVRVERDAQRWVYSLDPGPLTEADDWMRRTIETWRRRFDALGQQLDAMEAEEER